MILEISAAIALAGITSSGVLWFRQRNMQRRHVQEIQALHALHAEKLRQNNLDRNRLLDALSDAFLIVDADHRVRFVNAAARDLFNQRELIDRSIEESLLDPRLLQGLLHSIKTGEHVQSRLVLSQQTSPRGDLENRGTNAWHVDAAPLPNPESLRPLTRVLIRDVTTEHQLDQVRKDFVANASHELRTPLAIINGYLENLLEDEILKDTAMAHRFLTIMRKHADRVSRIIEDMLVISKLESGEASALNIEPFRFRSCIDDVLERLESLITNQSATIKINMANPDLIIQGDRFYWTQVLFNLIENALKQNPLGKLTVEIGCNVVGNHVCIDVADNGVGIPSADLAHIFRRFYRVEKHHSQQEIKGTGLGLSIVKRAVEAHHGKISVTSKPGIETKFSIAIPHALTS